MEVSRQRLEKMIWSASISWVRAKNYGFKQKKISITKCGWKSCSSFVLVLKDGLIKEPVFSIMVQKPPTVQSNFSNKSISLNK